MASLSYEFSMKDLDPLSYFLGISFTRISFGIFLSQTTIVQEIIDRAHMSTCKLSFILGNVKSKLSVNSGNQYYDPT